MGLGQQLIAKHLDLMEEAGLITSSEEESPRGPKRKEYILNRSVSVTVDFAPHLFSAQLRSFETAPEVGKISETNSQLLERIRDIGRNPEEHERINPFGKLLTDIDERLSELDEERSLLLYVRNLAMKEATKAIDTLELENIPRRVLYQVLDEHSENVPTISKSLNLRESSIREVLTMLRREFLRDDHSS